jgi:KDO2-lipid IV(A) lauroyltransferase
MAEGKRAGNQGILKQPPVCHAGSRAFIARIPYRCVAIGGKLLGMIAYILDGRHRRIVKHNLRFIYPDWPADRIRELSLRIFQHVGITVLEVCQLSRFSREDILRKVRVRGEEHLLDAVNTSKGTILISAHLGNWEIANMLVSCYVRTPLVLVARRMWPNALNQWVYRFRSRFGSVVLDKGGAFSKMGQVLRRGGAVALLIDQGTLFSEGIETHFFGKTVTATPAAAILARRYNSAVLPVFCIREKDGTFTAIVEPPLSFRKTKDIRGDLRYNTQMMNDAVERAIRAYPQQWFWLHKRWKRHYPELYPEDLEKQRRRKEKKKARLRKTQEGSSTAL